MLYGQERRVVSTGSLQQCFPIKLFHKRTLFHCNTSEPYHPSMIESVFPCGHDPPGQQFFTGRSAGLLPCAARSTVFVAKFFHKRTLFHCTSEPYHKSMLESVLPEVVAVEEGVFCYRGVIQESLGNAGEGRQDFRQPPKSRPLTIHASF